MSVETLQEAELWPVLYSNSLHGIPQLDFLLMLMFNFLNGDTGKEASPVQVGG